LSSEQVPTDIDFRIMLTFLELYQTLLGFAFFKLYTDCNLLYPPHLDLSKDDAGAGIGAHLLQETTASLLSQDEQGNNAAGPKISARQVKQQIKSIAAPAPAEDTDMVDAQAVVPFQPEVSDEETASKLFDGYHFYLSREVTRPFLEFVIRSFGGKVGWDSSLGAGSPFTDKDARVTHHVVDRPLPTDPEALAAMVSERNALPGRRAFIQPQWVVDCINGQTILSTGPYEPGATLPPHLSPFVDNKQIARQGGYVPKEALGELEAAPEEEEAESSAEEDDVADEAAPDAKSYPAALYASALDPTSEQLRHAAELEAESRNISHEAFEKERQAAIKSIKGQRGQKRAAPKEAEKEADLADIMVTGKKRKLLNNHQKRKEKQQNEVRRPPCVRGRLTFCIDSNAPAQEEGADEGSQGLEASGGLQLRFAFAVWVRLGRLRNIKQTSIELAQVKDGHARENRRVARVELYLPRLAVHDTSSTSWRLRLLVIRSTTTTND
jgi:pescadillo protein